MAGNASRFPAVGLELMNCAKNMEHRGFQLVCLTDFWRPHVQFSHKRRTQLFGPEFSAKKFGNITPASFLNHFSKCPRFLLSVVELATAVSLPGVPVMAGNRNLETGLLLLALTVLKRDACETESRRSVSGSGFGDGKSRLPMKKVVFCRIVVFLAVGLVLAETRVVALITPPLSAMPITLAWNAANDPTVSGYALYYGPTNQPATNRFDAGPNTSATIFGLRANVGYKLYAVSYTAAGLESVPSNELLLTPPAISRLQLVRQTNGSTQLSGKAAPGTLCTIQFTPTLQPTAWQTLALTTADQVGNVIALDTSGSKAKSRFYRLALGALPLLGGLQIQRQPDGNMLLSGEAPPGASCRVLYASTPNATSWQTLKTITADPEGKVTALDSTARQTTRRFYRMAMP